MFHYGWLKNEDKPFIGLTSIDIKMVIASTFTVEALAIGETLEIIEKIDSEQNLMIFSDLASMLKGISNPSTMNNTSHITQVLKDKIERLESRGKIIEFYWIPGHCLIEVNEMAVSETKHAIKEGRDSQLLLPVEKERQRRTSQFLSKHQTGQRRKIL
jgi:hypothetical protein